MEQRAFASTNPLPVASTHLASLNQLVEEEATNNNDKSIVQINLLSYRRGVEQRAFASSNPLRVASTHRASLNQLAEEEAINI